MCMYVCEYVCVCVCVCMRARARGSCLSLTLIQSLPSTPLLPFTISLLLLGVRRQLDRDSWGGLGRRHSDSCLQ